MLTMLTLGMICINVSAQTKKPVRGTATQMRKNTATSKPVQKDSREYKVEDDGFEWYLVCKNGKYGAESRDGIMLVPTEYTKVVYFDGFHTYMGEYSGYYNIKGKCIIPYNRQYNSILKKKRGLGEKEYDVFIVNKRKREDLSYEYPEQLKEIMNLRQWVCHKNKIPKEPVTGSNAKANEQST